MKTSIVFTQKQQSEIISHLFPGDGLEAAAIGLCSLASGNQRERLILHKVFLIPYDQCSRKADLLSWDTSLIFDQLDEASKHGFSILKMYGHGGNFDQFSLQDDSADKALFPSIHNWMKKKTKHFSAVLMPDGQVNFREITAEGKFIKGDAVCVIGDSLKFTEIKTGPSDLTSLDKKLMQTFGEKTHRLMKSLRIGVVGCSGTGSCVIEALKRHMTGELVLVDGDFVEEKNLNRIIGATLADAQNKEMKVNVFKREILRAGLGTHVIVHSYDLANPQVIRDLSTCDVIFGCMDTVSGRHLLNLICTYYSIPYFDVGVTLRADGKGGISEVVSASNYLQPGLSTLMSRGAYSSETLRSETMLLDDPLGYELHKKEGYIQDVNVDRPAVYTLNSLAAGFAMDDFLARLQGYRRNLGSCAQRIFSYVHDMYFNKRETEFETYEPWASKVGQGDLFFKNEAYRLKKVPKNAEPDVVC